MAAYGKKRLSLFLKPKDSQEFSFICRRTRIVAAYSVCKFKKKLNLGKNYEVLKFFAWGLRTKRLSLFLRPEIN